MAGQDTSYNFADVLSERLTGMVIRRIHVGPRTITTPFATVVSVGPNGIVTDLGEPMVRCVDTLGDTTIIEFANQIALVIGNTAHAHWYRYHPNAQWRKPAFQLSVALWTDCDAFVCMGTKSIEFLRSDQVTWDGRKTVHEIETGTRSGFQRFRRVASQ